MSANTEDSREVPVGEARAALLYLLTRRLEQDDRELEAQALELKKLQEQTEHEELMYKQGQEKLREHQSRFEAAELAIQEIYISTMLSHAHSILFMSNLGYNDEDAASRTADAILGEVDHLIEQASDGLSKSTLAKHAYVDGFLAEMKGDLITAEKCYVDAVGHDRNYIRLKRIQNLSDLRFAEYASTTTPQTPSEDDSETTTSRDSWLFANLRQAVATPFENGDSFNRCMINQVYLGHPSLNDKQSQPKSEIEGHQEGDQFQEASSRHAMPYMRKLSIRSEPVVEPVSLSDTPQPDALAKRPRRLSEAELRHEVPRIDTSGLSRPVESPTSPSRPSPLSRQILADEDVYRSS